MVHNNTVGQRVRFCYSRCGRSPSFQSVQYSGSGFKSASHVLHVMQVGVGVKVVFDVVSPENRLSSVLKSFSLRRSL
jgi:ribosomal protein L19